MSLCHGDKTKERVELAPVDKERNKPGQNIFLLSI